MIGRNEVMNVVLISNYLTHHQLPFCKAVIKKYIDFTFIATEPIERERQLMGYVDMNKVYDFVFCAYESEENKLKAKSICDSCDALITGSAPDHYFIDRVKAGKLTIKYGERFFKKPFTASNTFRRIASMWKHFIPYQNNNYYLLCASAFMPQDCHMFRCFENRMYKWGYFPETRTYANISNLISMKEKRSILWAGRLIKWKHPEAAIEIATRLKKDNQDFVMSIIGNGEMESKLKMMINEYGLQNEVKLLGAMSPEKVRTYMEKSEVFLFTSDREEGWGAVLNEAMNSGCAVAAGSMIGAVPYLINDGINGMVFKDCDWDELYKKVNLIINDDCYRKKIAVNAYHTITDLWCAEVAADRLIKLVYAILNHDTADIFDTGPCSKAEIIKSGWY